MKKIIVLTAVFAMVFTGAAIAADWNFYGSSRMALFSETWDKDYAPNTITGKDFTTTTFDQQGNSRIGANVSAGDVGGKFELGIGSTVGIRQLYGTWNFGSGTMLVGRTWNPTYSGLSNQVYGGDNNLGWFGGAWTRYPSIQFQFGGFKIAALTPQAPALGAPYTTTKGAIPKIEGAWNGNMGPVNLHLSAGFNTWDGVDPATNNSKAVTSYIGNVIVKYNAGPFMVGGAFSYGQNFGDYWPAYPPAGGSGSGTVPGRARLVAGEVKDATSMSFAVVAGFTVNDMVGLEAGYGYGVADYDASVAPKDDTGMAYYFQVPLTLADGVFIVPEVGVHDFDKDENDNKEGKITYLGAKFQINF